MANIFTAGYETLGQAINKIRGKGGGQESDQGVVSEKFPELTLDMDNDALIKLTEKWNKSWTDSEVYGTVSKKGEDSENYWLNNHFKRGDSVANVPRPISDNLIFESLETWLPQVTQHNPESLVELAAGVPQTPENLAYANQVKYKLADIADELNFRLKLKKGARHWAIYLLGVAKVGWDLEKDIPSTKIIRPAKIILDPDSTIDEDGYTGKFIGENRRLEASVLIDLLENMDAEKGAVEAIKDLVKEDLGTEVGFIEWWTKQYMCWTMGKQVLMKKKNPNWNYPKKVEAPADEMTGETPVDEETQEPQTQEQPVFNHLKAKDFPYRFLSVFNLGKHPVDDTSLITQNLPSQDMVNTTLKQIVKNVAGMNGGIAVSGSLSGLAFEEAGDVAKAVRDGGIVYIPQGRVSDALMKLDTPALPRDVYEHLQDTRSRMKYMFGVQGFQPVSGGGQSAVRMQVMNKNLDDARISGGFTEYLEQWADDLYNLQLQMLYVYDDKFSMAAHSDTPPPLLKISIKEGSMLPKDSTTLSAQAIQLAESNRMSLVDLYKKLEYPNPEEMAANVWLEANAPEIMFENDPRVQKAIQMKQQAAQNAGQKPPSESINYKDLPPEGKAQLAAKAGITLHPEGIAAHDEHLKNQDAQRKQQEQPQAESNAAPGQ